MGFDTVALLSGKVAHPPVTRIANKIIRQRILDFTIDLSFTTLVRPNGDVTQRPDLAGLQIYPSHLLIFGSSLRKSRDCFECH